MDVLLMTFVLGLLLAVLIIVPLLRSSNEEKNKELNASKKTKTLKIYSKEEVSLHNTRTDCWLIIKDKVYDVTSYVEEHPGGDAILRHAGDDTTEGFYGPQHGGGVFQLIEDFHIGDLEK
ncbi:oxidoreductase [Lithospermum erythrorhizon]|uniref:Oxidoreductase n=1 Tax=Lithospermum erythrorhizon TaxID=34254 RepID=A0AAV3PCU7_LITER